MLRIATFGVSAIALMTSVAFAQDPTISTATADDAVAVDNSEILDTAKTSAEPQILDASQVNTRSDAELFAKSEFKQADLNSDGKVDESEFVAYASVRAPLPSTAPSVALSTATGEAPVADTTADAGTAEDQFAELSNGGESISETEMVNARVEQFEAADADGDERLDTQERIQFAALTKLKTASDSL